MFIAYVFHYESEFHKPKSAFNFRCIVDAIANRVFRKGYSKSRVIEPVFNQGCDCKYTLTLISKQVSDEELEGLLEGVWLFETVQETKDRKGDMVRFCKPVRFFCKAYEVFQSPYILDALGITFCEDIEAQNQPFVKELKAKLGRRISYQSGHKIEGLWDWIREQIKTGTVSLKTLAQWVDTPVPVDWSQAMLAPATDFVHIKAVESIFRFRDLNSGEDETLDICSDNLDSYRSIIPEYIKITQKSRCQLALEILMNKVFAISYDKSDRVYGNVLAALQQTDALWVKVTPYVDRPDVQLDVGVEKNSVSFPRILEGYGIRELNGQYIPSDVPDWELTKVNGYRPEDDVYEITSPTTCMVNAKFLNGMTGRYPLIYMIKRYPGKCLNASFSIKGNSLSSMRVNILLSSKGGNV